MHRDFKGVYVDSTQPHLAWEQIKSQQIHKSVTLPLFEARDHSLRVVCISDTHNQHDAFVLPEGDILIHAGDFSGTGTFRQVSDFIDWFTSRPHRIKILVAGNHDITLERDYYEKMWPRFHRRKKLDDHVIRQLINSADERGELYYLLDREIEVDGIRIYGSPWQPEFCSWGFNLSRGQECAEKWRQIPTGVDILITHGPPLGHGDLLVYDHTHCGCVDLLAEVQHRVRPKYHIFGHIHEGYGVTSDDVTTFINASICTHEYHPTQPPLVFDLLCPVS